MVIVEKRKRLTNNESLWNRIPIQIIIQTVLILLLVLLFITSASILIIISNNNNKLQINNTPQEEQSSASEQHSRTAITEQEELVLNGHVHLIDIHFGRDTLGLADGEYSVDGIFCHIPWELHKQDPAAVPMYNDLIAKSKDCQKNKFHLDLQSIVNKARIFDSKQKQKQNPSSTSEDDNRIQQQQQQVVHVMEPTGFVFHESRCGSTLVANALVALNPQQNRVYSESSPPLTAAKYASSSSRIQLLRDVIYIMGRTSNPLEQDLFFKIQSIGTKSLHIFQMAFPTVPWIFVYRDPIQVMMSHLKTKDQKNAVCLRNRHTNHDIKALALNLGIIKKKDLSHLSKEELCAAHLATLCEAALEQQQQNSNSLGRMVNYKDLPNILIQDIFPNHFLHHHNDNQNHQNNVVVDGAELLSLDSDAITRILDISSKYSKGRKAKYGLWESDNKVKEEMARPEIHSASSLFLQPLYERLEERRIKEI